MVFRMRLVERRCGVRYAVCGVRYVVCGVWCVVCGALVVGVLVLCDVVYWCVVSVWSARFGAVRCAVCRCVYIYIYM